MFDLAHIDVAEPKFKAQSYAIYARLVPQVRAISPRHHIPKERAAAERRFWTVSRQPGSYSAVHLAARRFRENREVRKTSGEHCTRFRSARRVPLLSTTDAELSPWLPFHRASLFSK